MYRLQPGKARNVLNRTCEPSWQLHDSFPLAPEVLGRSRVSGKQFSRFAPLQRCCVREALALVALRGAAVLKCLGGNSDSRQPACSNCYRQVVIFTASHGGSPWLTATKCPYSKCRATSELPTKRPCSGGQHPATLSRPTTKQQITLRRLAAQRRAAEQFTCLWPTDTSLWRRQ